MTFDLADWQVQVDLDATWRHTRDNASDHCECAYCRNFYETARCKKKAKSITRMRFPKKIIL